jgi:hypothetical protein
MKTTARIVGIGAALTPTIASAEGSTKAKAGVVRCRVDVSRLPIFDFCIRKSLESVVKFRQHQSWDTLSRVAPNRVDLNPWHVV